MPMRVADDGDSRNGPRGLHVMRAEVQMTIEPTSLLQISIGTIIALISIVAAAAVTWTRLGMRMETLTGRMETLAVAFAKLESWHLKATQSARDELDDAVESFRSRHHQQSSRLQQFELRLARIEDRTGIPSAMASDPTPIVSEPRERTRPRRVVEESE